jgi:hypothetical protein
MKLHARGLAVGLCLGAALVGQAQAADKPPVKIGILTDMSGTYAGMGGPGSVAAAQLAIDDCLAAECKGMKIELVSADNQNKADVGAAKAREWFDRDGVTAIADLTNSAVALAVQGIAREKNKVVMFSGPATTALTNKECSPVGFHWMFDTYSQSAGGAKATVKAGGKSWYFITVDYAFGHSLEADTAKAVQALGGTVAGSVRHPLNAPDFASYLLQAQASKAQVVALANGGQDTVNAVKQAREFGIVADFLVGPARAGPGKRPGPVVRGRLLLGLRRRHAPVVRALRESVPRPETHHDAGRRVLQRAALPALGRRFRQHRRQGGGRQDARAAHRGSDHAQRVHPSRRPRDPRHVPV